MSKIIVMGASGTIGRAVADLLGQTHQVFRVGNRQMDKAGTMSATETAKAYQSSVAGNMTGQVLDVRDYGKVE